MMQLANTLWLWGLLGLSVPLAIHLLSRKEGKVIRVGSIRHLTDSTTRRFRSIKLNEILLLAIRSLLIGLVCILLAGLLVRTGDEAPKWVLVESVIENEPNVVRIADSLVNAGYEYHVLETGFPVAHDTINRQTVPSYWALADELGKQQLGRVIVFSASFITGFKGKRGSLPENITWVEVPVHDREFQHRQISDESSLWEVNGESDAIYTSFTNIKVDGTPREQPPVRVAIVADADHKTDEAVLRAALEVLDSMPGYKLELVTAAPAATQVTADVVFWLTTDKAVDGPGQVVEMVERPSGELLERRTATRWMLTKRLNTQTVLQEHLVIQLAGIFEPLFALPPTLEDVRVMPESWRWKEEQAKKTARNQQASTFSEVSALLVILIMLTLLAERLIAWRRSQ